MKVFVMRGLPGAGKSTWIANYIRESTSHAPKIVISADAYHMETVDGERKYVYRPERAGEAHNKCLIQFMHHCDPLLSGEIFVDNTNISAWEISPYYRIAEARGCEVEIVHLVVDGKTAVERNKHGVPAEAIERMLLRFDVLPKWWNVRWERTYTPKDEGYSSSIVSS